MHKHCCNRPSKYSPVTHVIFDLDGTIIDSEHVYQKAIQHGVEKYGVTYEEDFVLKVQGRVQYDTCKIAVEYFKLPCSIEEYMELFNGYANQYLSDLDLMPGAERLITHLHKHKIPMCIATSSGQGSYDLKMTKFPDLCAMFHHVVCGGTDPEVTNGKPAPDIFLLAASRFEEPVPSPSACLVLEDSVNGLLAGLAAGMQVVMIPEPNVAYHEWKQATMRLDSLNYIVPEAFGLPAFTDKEMAKEFANTRVIKYGDSSFVLPSGAETTRETEAEKPELPKIPPKTDQTAKKIHFPSQDVTTTDDESSLAKEPPKQDKQSDSAEEIEITKQDLTKADEEPAPAKIIELPEQEPSFIEESPVASDTAAAANESGIGEPQAESSREDFETAIEGDTEEEATADDEQYQTAQDA